MPGKQSYKNNGHTRFSGIALLLLLLFLAVATFFMLSWLPGQSEVSPTPSITAKPTATPTPTPTPSPTPTMMQVVRINLSDTSSSVRVREQASTTAQVLGEAPHNTTLPYLGESDGWWIVNYEGKTGYIGADFGVLETVTVTPSPTPTVSPSASN